MDLESAWQQAAAEVAENTTAAPTSAKSKKRSDPFNAGPSTSCAIRASLTPPAPRKPRKRFGGSQLAVRKALGAIETKVHAADLTLDEAAVAIVTVVEQFGLRPVRGAAAAATRDNRR